MPGTGVVEVGATAPPVDVLSYSETMSWVISIPLEAYSTGVFGLLTSRIIE
jgi:hypothetical protein